MKISKKFAIAGSIATLAIGGGAAFAYWSTTGSGTGSADAAASASTMTLSTNFDAGITPGTSKTVTVKADNPTDGGLSLYGTTLSFVVSTDTEGCTAADFSISAVAADNVTVAAGADDTTVGTATLNMLNRDVNQDACKGATITVDVTAAAGS